jgi:tetratricopeptide (TPR) repeat protein
MSGVMVSPIRPAARPVPSIPLPAADVFDIIGEYIEAGRLDRAERLLGHVLAAVPDMGDALHLKGLIAARRKRSADAAALMERALAQGARKPAQLRNLSEVYRVLGRLDQALTLARQSIAGDPADPLGPFNLAMIHYDRLEIGPCLAAARHSLALRANLPQSHMKLAQAHLLAGEMEPGWAEYEWRYQIPGAQALMPATDRPQWDGRPLPDQTLLLIGDQGFGDVVMFMRYIPWALTLCPNIAVACSAEMQPLLARTYPQVRTFTKWDETPPYAAYCPLSGLPMRHGTRLDTVPNDGPYIAAEPERQALWAERLAARIPAGLKRIGIAWAGRPTHNNDYNRSVALSVLAPLAAVPGVAFVSLQKGDGAAQAAQWPGPAPLVDFGAQLDTFDDTMAIIAGLDLLVTVDTAIGHFAGAMGVPAWIMLPYAPDWRWLMERTDTPWYDSLRLFRPPAIRRWDVVVADVTKALAACDWRSLGDPR